MAKLEIAALGPLQITIDQAPVSGFISDKVRGLLVYLAVEQPRPLRREALAALFWPDQPKAKALANLRRALANLRRVIDDENGRFLYITRQTLQFNADSQATVDAIQFAQLLGGGEPTLAQMEGAVKLINGRFLEGFSIDDSIAFEEWALLKQEQIQRQLLHTLNRLTAYYQAHHQPEIAVRYAWQQVNIEPWYEPGQRQLLRLLVQTRQRAAALAHYEQFQQELADELGVRPEPATRHLYEQIHQRQLEITADESSPAFLAEPPSTTLQPFVARAPELARLHGFLETAVAGQGKVAFVTGEAGSGKTSLLQTFARQAQKQCPRLIPLFGSCQAHIGPGNPYLPFRMILAHALGDVEALWRSGVFSRAQANRLWHLRQTAVALMQDVAPDCLMTLVDALLLPEDLPPTAVVKAPPQEILFQQMTHFLQQFSQHGPLLLLLDDLHWADSGSIDLLFYLQRQLAGYPILLLDTYRPEALLPVPPGENQHPLARLVHELTTNFGDIEVALNRADGREFVDAWLDTEPNQLDESFRQTLFSQTQGHALFTVELVADLQESGELWRDPNGIWQVGELVSLSHLPTKTEAIIAERFGRLSPSLRQLLYAASIQGEVFVAELVAQVVNRPIAEIIQSLSGPLARGHRLVRVVGRHLLGKETVSRYRFRHSLFQQYVYGRLDPNERAYLHQMTGELLVQLYKTADVALISAAAELAYHFEAAQTLSKAVHYCQLAGEHALRLSAHAEAINHYHRGLALLSSLPETPDRIRQEIDCQLALGAALLAVHGYAAPEVKEVYDWAFFLCGRVVATAETVTSLFWLTSYYAVSGDLAQAVLVSQQMLAIADQESVSAMHQMQAHVLAGLPLFFMGCNEEALAHFRQASSLYDPARHQPMVYTFGQDPGIGAMIWQGHVLLHIGCIAEARGCLQQALDWAAMLDHPYTAAFTHLLAGGTPNVWYVWDLATAMGHVQTAVQLAQEGNFAHVLALGTFYLGYLKAVTCLLQQGDIDEESVAEGFALMEQGMTLEAEIGSKLGLSSRWLLLADVHRQYGQIEQAWHALQQAEMEAYGRRELYFEAEILRLKGELYLLAGDVAQAKASWQKAIYSARRQRAKTWEHRAEAALQRLG
ncbi:MAG: hypothetical protein CL608_05310 [Anaerolineaceae bacterium]|nr:hypothetical protein [Anaerolineaceae bacterium]